MLKGAKSTSSSTQKKSNSAWQRRHKYTPNYCYLLTLLTATVGPSEQMGNVATHDAQHSLQAKEPKALQGAWSVDHAVLAHRTTSKAPL